MIYNQKWFSKHVYLLKNISLSLHKLRQHNKNLMMHQTKINTTINTN